VQPEGLQIKNGSNATHKFPKAYGGIPMHLLLDFAWYAPQLLQAPMLKNDFGTTTHKNKPYEHF